MEFKFEEFLHVSGNLSAEEQEEIKRLLQVHHEGCQTEHHLERSDGKLQKAFSNCLNRRESSGWKQRLPPCIPSKLNPGSVYKF